MRTVPSEPFVLQYTRKKPPHWRSYRVRSMIWSFGGMVFSEVEGEWAAELHVGSWVVGIERVRDED